MNQVKTNTVTKNKYIEISGVLEGISGTILTMANEKKTQYRIGTVTIGDKNNGKKTITGFIYETNFQKGTFEMGKSYLTRIEDTGQPNPIVVISPLIAGERVSASAFNWETGEINFSASPVVTPARQAAPMSGLEVETVIPAVTSGGRK